MAQIPSVSDAASTFTAVDLVQWLRPVSPVHPVTGTRSANSDSNGQAGQQAHVARPAAAAAAADSADGQPLEEAVEEINVFLMGVPTDLRFEVDDTLGRVIVSVVDSESGSVLRQLPGKEVLEIARRIRDHAPAGLFDSMA